MRGNGSATQVRSDAACAVRLPSGTILTLSGAKLWPNINQYKALMLGQLTKVVLRLDAT